MSRAERELRREESARKDAIAAAGVEATREGHDVTVETTRDNNETQVEIASDRNETTLEVADIGAEAKAKAAAKKPTPGGK